MVNTLKIIIFIGLVSMTFAAVLMSIFVSEHIDDQEIEEDGTELRCNLWNGTYSHIEYNVTYDTFTRHDNKDFESNGNKELNRFDLSIIENAVNDRSLKDKIEEHTNYSVYVYFDSHEYKDSLYFEISGTYYESISVFYPFMRTENIFESDECLEYIKIYKEIE